jgi:hypothetical protein
MNRRRAELVRAQVWCSPLETVRDAGQLDAGVDRGRTFAKVQIHSFGIVELRRLGKVRR